MSHPYEVLGGGVGGNVHNPAHFVARPELLILNPPEALCFATIRNPTSPARTHRVFYARLFGGQCRERTAAEKLSCVHEQGPIKLLFVQGLGGTHAQFMVGSLCARRAARARVLGSVELTPLGRQSNKLSISPWTRASTWWRWTTAASGFPTRRTTGGGAHRISHTTSPRS